MPEQSLKERTAKGLLWGGVSNGIVQLLNLAFGICLLNLLTPEDYGTVQILAIFSSVATCLQDSGFTVALANKKSPTHADYNAVFWFSVLCGAFLYVVLFFCAPLIARFYHDPLPARPRVWMRLLKEELKLVRLPLFFWRYCRFRSPPPSPSARKWCGSFRL